MGVDDACMYVYDSDDKLKAKNVIVSSCIIK